MSHAIFTKIPPVVFKIIRCFPFFFRLQLSFLFGFEQPRQATE